MAQLGEHADEENLKALAHSTRLALNSVVTRLKQKYESTEDPTLNEKIRLLVQSLSQLNEILLKS